MESAFFEPDPYMYTVGRLRGWGEVRLGPPAKIYLSFRDPVKIKENQAFLRKTIENWIEPVWIWRFLTSFTLKLIQILD